LKSPWLSPYIEQHGRYESGTVFAKRNHISLSKLIKWIEQGLIKGSTRVLESNTRQVTIEREQDEIAGHLKTRFTLSELSEQIGLSEKTIRHLVRLGIVDAEPPVPGDCWTIEQAEAEKLESQLRALAVDPDGPHEFISLDKLMRYYTCSEHNCAELIQALMKQEIRFCLSPRNGELLTRLRVSLDDYKVWIVGNELLSIPEFALLMGIKQEVAYHLVNRKLIEVIDKGRLGRFIATEELKRFRRTFVFSARLATQYSTSARHIVDILSKQGIPPIAGPSVDGSRQYIFLRDQVSECFFMRDK
jgi:hypothetical protein